LRGQDQARIEAKIDALADDPRPPGCEPVKAATRGTYRVRVGDYRVIYTILDDEQMVVVARVARRGSTPTKGYDRNTLRLLHTHNEARI
jgi:mRNA-degrading endonuclease RelE of RelBE toxin-antitoxin system